MVELSDADRHLAEIDENLRRNDLSALERGEHTASRKAWYEAKHPETKQGAQGGGRGGRGTRRKTESADPAFSVDTAAKTGQSKRSVQVDVQVAESIPEDVREQLHESAIADAKTSPPTSAARRSSSWSRRPRRFSLSRPTFPRIPWKSRGWVGRRRRMLLKKLPSESASPLRPSARQGAWSRRSRRVIREQPEFRADSARNSGGRPKEPGSLRDVAERKAGEVLATMEKSPPGPIPKIDSPTESISRPPRLTDLGITPKQSMNWQAEWRRYDTISEALSDSAVRMGVLRAFERPGECPDARRKP